MKLQLLAGAVGATILPSAAAGQLVLRDDVDGWGWIGMIEGRRAVAQLAYGNPQTGAQGGSTPSFSRISSGGVSAGSSAPPPSTPR
jgi:hypothetical protein